MLHNAVLPPVAPGILERFRKAKQAEIDTLRRAAAQQRLPAVRAVDRPSFRDALLRGCTASLPAFVAEYKIASPSRGILRPDDSQNLSFSPEDAAQSYHAAGASCMSVLTEECHFKGSLEHLERAHRAMAAAKLSPLPLLRKDFICDPLQVRHTAATHAAALLLIVRLTPQVALLRALREQAASYGIEAVVEVFTPEDLALARESGATLLQVNARDLETFAVDTTACLGMAREYRRGHSNECWIAASGIGTAQEARAARQAGYDAVLVGTALMESLDPGQALRRLREQP